MPVAASAIYFLNLRGDVLINRLYRDDVGFRLFSGILGLHCRESMSEIKVSNTMAQSEDALSHQSSSDLQNIQGAYRLNGKNYLKWSQFIQTYLKGRGKLSHLLGTRPKEGDPRYDEWDEADSMIMS